MKRQILTCSLAAGLGILCLVSNPAPSYSQCQTITDFVVKSLLEVSFEATVTFNDNSTGSNTIYPDTEVLFTAPTGKSIVKLTVGGKTVDLPMDPTPQTGWNIPNVPSGYTVAAHSSMRYQPIWQPTWYHSGTYDEDIECGILFWY